MTIGSNETRAIDVSRYRIVESVKNGLSWGYIATEWRIKGTNRCTAFIPTKSCEDRSNFIESLCCIAPSPIMMILYLANTARISHHHKYRRLFNRYRRRREAALGSGFVSVLILGGQSNLGRES